MNKLGKIIEKLSFEELQAIKKDLESGNLNTLIDKRLEQKKPRSCPVCGENVLNDSYILEFGKDYLRKKAYFDGADCLNYFVATRLKKDESKRV